MCQKPCKGQIYARKVSKLHGGNAKNIGGKAEREGGSGREIEMAKESVDKVHDDAFKYFMP